MYTAAIFASLSAAPRLWERVDAALKGQGMLLQTVLYCLAGAGVFAYLVYVKNENKLARYLWFFGCVLAAWFLLKQTPLASERVHFAEYGLLGVLLYNALKLEADGLDPWLYVCGALICVAIGALDEITQSFLPNRYFDWRDLFLNGASGAIALGLIRFCVIRQEE